MKLWQIVLIIVIIAAVIFGIVAYTNAQRRKMATVNTPVVATGDERKNIWEIISGITGVIGTSRT